MLEEVGAWMGHHAEAIEASEPFGVDPHDPSIGRGDWMHHGRYTVRGTTLYLLLLRWPGSNFSIDGLEAGVLACRLLHDGSAVSFAQAERRVTFDGLPEDSPTGFGGVIAVNCDRPPRLLLCGGLRTPTVSYPRYDPVAPDLPW